MLWILEEMVKLHYVRMVKRLVHFDLIHYFHLVPALAQVGLCEDLCSVLSLLGETCDLINLSESSLLG
jgi:hypothetical protein